MTTVSLAHSSSEVSTPACGSWSGTTWLASGCAVNATAQLTAKFAHSIPIGSVITAMGCSVTSHTSGLSAAPGTVSAYFNTISQPGLAETTMTGLPVERGFSASGGFPFTVTSAADFEVGLTFTNKENFYSNSHVMDSFGTLNITYTPPSKNNLFFGSNF